MTSTLITGATIIDAVTDIPREGHALWIEDGRIKAIAPQHELKLPPGTKVIDAHGKYVIPGLMNANVHLLMDIRLENLARYIGRYEELIVEAAQVALRSGLTTVFDTYGPRRFLMEARDKIAAGKAIGSRIFCAGNIVGFDGPFSEDFNFFAKGADVASAAMSKRINSIWVENVGRHLMWLPPEHIAQEIRAYIAKGINFVKYGSNDHYPGAFLAFSPDAQAAIVGEAHRAGLTAQAHTMSVEGLRVAIEAGCDLIQHANVTGPVPIPESTLELMVRRKTGAVVFPWTQRGFEWILENVNDMERSMWLASDANARSLIRAGARLLLANDGAIFAPEKATTPTLNKSWGAAPAEESLISLSEGHFNWFRAMEEKGCAALDMLRAATLNIATAYGVAHDLGTLEAGKIADLLVLDRNPLAAAENYRSIHLIIKDGVLVDRDVLPQNPLLTRPMDAPAEEEASYIPFIAPRSTRPPVCPGCMRR